jgi:hypothetical protein
MFKRMVEEARSEPRTIIDEYYSVEFTTSGDPLLYQFRIWDISSKGMCVLVKEDSSLVAHLKVGAVIDMRYYRPGSSTPTDYQKTEIKHITKDDSGRFKGHYLVGLYILDR